MIRSALETPGIYFSYGYDLTHSLQRLHSVAADFHKVLVKTGGCEVRHEMLQNSNYIRYAWALVRLLCTSNCAFSNFTAIIWFDIILHSSFSYQYVKQQSLR